MALQATPWTCSPYPVAAADRLATELGLSPTAAAILVRRGYATVEAAARFLAADERHDAFAFAGMGEACRTVLGHVERGSKIVVHGDYDVDGVASTAVMLSILRELGADPRWHLPSRFEDGYGLSAATVERLAHEGAGLLVTTDCGITSADEVARAIELGLDVLVTDHHRPGERLPACPVVHPTVCGYPCRDLCATGVVYKLAEALARSAGLDPGLAERELDLVALATLADVVPLTGENRRLVRAGLAALGRTSRPGLRALMAAASLDPAAVDERTAAFRLAPRLNAAGRLGRADAALELLLTRDEERANEVAGELDALNSERRDTETRILFAAETERAEQAHAPAYVLAGEGWNPGVIGIVASRMVERHHRPCLVISLEDAVGRGSGRSIAAFDLHAALAACSGLLRRFGGHPAAAGFEIDAERVGDLRRAFSGHAASVLSPHDLRPLECADAVVSGDSLGIELAEELTALGPYGQGNPQPTLLLPGARLADVHAMGDDDQHSRFTLQTGAARARGVAFRTSANSLAGARDDAHDVALRLELGEWNGVVEPRVIVRGVSPTEPGNCTVLGEQLPFWKRLTAELARDPSEAPLGSLPAPRGEGRLVRDRTGRGVAGVAGDLLSSGERVLIVGADAARRVRTIERVLGGLARAGGAAEPEPGALALASWAALAREPESATGYAHVLALDPPPLAAAEALLGQLPSGEVRGFAYLAWGSPEIEFSLAVVRAELFLDEPLKALYRALRASGDGASGPQLEALLRGEAHPRSPELCARLLRVLCELGLVAFDPDAAGGPSCRLLPASRTSLERSDSYRAFISRLAACERYLGGLRGARPQAGRAPPPEPRPAPASVA